MELDPDVELKLIPGTLGFYAGSDGEIYDPQKVKRNTYRNSDCYVTASVLVRKDKWVTFGVHRLVALAFHGEPKEGFDQVNHLDLDISNNRPSNLEWVSVYQNNIYAQITRKDNIRPSIIGRCGLVEEEDFFEPALFRNIWDAAVTTDIDAQEIWNAIKTGGEVEDINGIYWRFTFQGYSDNIPESLQKNRIPKRGADGRACETPIKSRDIETGVEQSYSSMKVAADYHKTTPSHIHQSIPQRDGVIRIFRKQLQFAYVYQDFPELTEEDVQRIKNTGPRSVMAYNYSEARVYVFGCATEFLEHSKLSKKAVTVALARSRLRRIGDWAALYLSDDNARDLMAFVNGSSQDKDQN